MSGTQVVAAARPAVAIRPVLPADLAALSDFFAGLSAQSRYLRFFSQVTPGPALLRRLSGGAVTLDAVIAVADGVIIGHAMAADRAASRGDRMTDIGVVVADAWQGEGTGSALVRALLARAQARGVTAVAMDILPGNYQVLAMIARHWPTARTDHAPDYVTIEIRVQQATGMTSFASPVLPVPAQHALARLALTSVGPIDQPVVDLLFHEVGYARMLADKVTVGRGLHDQGPDRNERDNGGGTRLPWHRRRFTDQVARTPFGYHSFLPVLLEADLRPALENHHDLTGRFTLAHERGTGWKRLHMCCRFKGPPLSRAKDAPEVDGPDIARRQRATEGPLDIESGHAIGALLTSLVQPVKDVPVVSSIRRYLRAHSRAPFQSRGAIRDSCCRA